MWCTVTLRRSGPLLGDLRSLRVLQHGWSVVIWVLFPTTDTGDTVPFSPPSSGCRHTWSWKSKRSVMFHYVCLLTNFHQKHRWNWPVTSGSKATQMEGRSPGLGLSVTNGPSCPLPQPHSLGEDLWTGVRDSERLHV